VEQNSTFKKVEQNSTFRKSGAKPLSSEIVEVDQNRDLPLCITYSIIRIAVEVRGFPLLDKITD